MSPTKRVGLAGAVALMLTGGSYADTTPDGVTNDELRARVVELEATVAELKAGQGDNWLTEQRADEVRGLVQDVLADADTRASLLTQGMTAGYDDGFVLGSADGAFSMKINGQIQFRWVYSLQDNSGDAATSMDDNRWGFENSRTKLIFTGNIISQDWTYKLETNFDSDGGDLMLEDAWVNYDFGNGLHLKFGQFKDPLLREELVDSRYQLAVERSLVNEIVTNDRVQGVELGYYGDMFRGWAAYSDGSIGGPNSAALTEDTEFAFTLRAEGLLMGNWGQFDTMTSPNGDETGVLVGGAFSYEKAEAGTSTPGGDTEITTVTGDVTAEFGGANVFAAITYSNLDTDIGPVDADIFAFVAQGGYYLTDEWEGFLRYEYADLDDFGIEDVNIFTVGFNYYIGADPNAKWTTDIGVGL
ncbi:MAG: porin, partial [Planctomycetota bacterium]